MKKRNRGILILMIALVVLLLAYAGLRIWNGEQEQKSFCFFRNRTSLDG